MTGKQYSRQMIEMAASDIATSKLLFEHSQFLQSLFYLQQAVEKANKAVGLWADYIDVNEMKKLGHDHCNIHTKAVDFQIEIVQEMEADNIDMLSLFAGIFKCDPINTDEHTAAFMQIRDLKQQVKAMNIFTATYEDLSEQVKELQSIGEFIRFDGTEEDIHENVSVWVKKLIGQLTGTAAENDAAEFIHQISSVLGSQLKTVVKLMVPILQLHVLGFAVTPLVQTRYPGIDQNPLHILTKEHPLLRITPAIQEMTTKAIRIIRFLQYKSPENL